MVATLALWTLIGPITVDDGYIAGIVRGRGENGYVGNVYRWLNAPEAPFGWFYELYHLWSQVSAAPLWLRLPSTLLGILCWILLSRLVIPRVGVRSRWLTAVTFLAWWLPFNLGLRPEPWVAAGSLAAFCLVERAIALRAPRPLALALLIAGLTTAVTPSGLMAFAPVLAALRPVLRLVRANPALPAAAMACALLPMFADQSFAAVVEATRVRKLIGGDQPWFEEFDRYARLLEPGTFEGSLARRAPVLLTLLGLLGWVRGRAAADRMALAVVLSLGVLVISPTKWTHHFGALAGIGAAVLALCLASWSAGRVGRPWSGGGDPVGVSGRGGVVGALGGGGSVRVSGPGGSARALGGGDPARVSGGDGVVGESSAGDPVQVPDGDGVAQVPGAGDPERPSGEDDPAGVPDGADPAQVPGAADLPQSSGGADPVGVSGGADLAWQSGGADPVGVSGGADSARQPGGADPVGVPGGADPAWQSGGAYPARQPGGANPVGVSGGADPPGTPNAPAPAGTPNAAAPARSPNAAAPPGTPNPPAPAGTPNAPTPTPPESDLRRYRAGLIAVAITVGLVLAGWNRWPWISDYGLTWSTMAPALLGIRLSDLALLGAPLGALLATWSLRRRAPSPGLIVTALLAAVVVFTVGTLARADRGYLRAPCGLADELQVETDPTRGQLPAVDGWFALDPARRDLPVVTTSRGEVEIVFARKDKSIVSTQRSSGEVRVLAPEGAELVRFSGPADPPRSPVLTPMAEILPPGTTAVLDWPVAFLFPCLRPAAISGGAAEIPGWRVAPPSTDGSAHITYDLDKGGPFASARVREQQLPVYLRDDPTRDVARLYRWEPIPSVQPSFGTRTVPGWHRDGRTGVPGL
ncbi:hypothetical protein GCM10010470_56650 [Saccharopolyspora taberi]|uniref:Uncharacterized protein n=1 Tax=Saccharopolyspora taberi TaxID=60895 RepID=A0ABN3VN98_9PSEU